MSQLEVLLKLGFLVWAGFAEGGRLAVMIIIELGQEGLVGRLGEHALFLQDRQDAHRLQHAT